MKNRTHLKSIATERIEYLHSLLSMDSPVRKETIIEAMENLAIRFDVTLSVQIKREYCKSCKTPYDHSTRIRCKKGIIRVTCLSCGNIRRFPIKID